MTACAVARFDEIEFAWTAGWGARVIARSAGQSITYTAPTVSRGTNVLTLTTALTVTVRGTGRRAAAGTSDTRTFAVETVVEDVPSALDPTDPGNVDLSVDPIGVPTVTWSASSRGSAQGAPNVSDYGVLIWNASPGQTFADIGIAARVRVVGRLPTSARTHTFPALPAGRYYAEVRATAGRGTANVRRSGWAASNTVAVP